MKFRRVVLRFYLKAQKNYLKLKNLRLIDFYKIIFDFTKRFPDIIHLKNLVLFCTIFSIISLIFFGVSFERMQDLYLREARIGGGTYAEGKIGKFLRLNPLYSQTNPVDEDAVNLIFNGLMKRGAERRLERDLAERYAVSEDKKVYTFKLHDNIFWHDGQKLSAEDVLFTVNAIQNPDVRSSYYETWKGVKAEKINDLEVKFTLKQTLESFLEDTTLKILPKHLFEKVPAVNFQTVEFNNKPIGTGPYRFKYLQKDFGKETLLLDVNEDYFDGKPTIEQVKFVAYGKTEEMIKDYEKKNINAISPASLEIRKELDDMENIRFSEYQLPRYVVAILNTNSAFLKDKNLRIALAHSVNKAEILDKSVRGQGFIVESPLIPGTFGYSAKITQPGFDKRKAEEILNTNGYEKKDGRYYKDGKAVELKIGVGTSQEMKKTAETIAENLTAVGIKASIDSKDSTAFQKEIVRSRNYDILIIGTSLGYDPDIFSYWHSSQANDPGLNLAGFKDRKLDKYLEQYRELTAADAKRAKLQEIQEVLVSEMPAIYLYNPFYYSAASSDIKGLQSGKIVYEQDRFAGIKDWYVNFERVMIE